MRQAARLVNRGNDTMKVVLMLAYCCESAGRSRDNLAVGSCRSEFPGDAAPAIENFIHRLIENAVLPSG